MEEEGLEVEEEGFFLGGTPNLSAKRAGFNSVSHTSILESVGASERVAPCPGGVIDGELTADRLLPAILGGEVSPIVTSREAITAVVAMVSRGKLSVPVELDCRESHNEVTRRF